LLPRRLVGSEFVSYSRTKGNEKRERTFPP
jgi:hypothetical protein